MGSESQRVSPSELSSSRLSGFNSSQPGPILWLVRESTTDTPIDCSSVQPPDVARCTFSGTFPRCQLDANWTNQRRPGTPTLHVNSATTKEPHQMVHPTSNS
ncbi:hypothetical protein TIFTF001_015070 [Ficus carica]|uniref:Uncharacterized protein n=1 Tax=Ficus carica TaxID=3494 RepID=A0AA88D8M0_FICCA|nr:hypothetical protein TIFTF001_015070 [Ficus carica]